MNKDLCPECLLELGNKACLKFWGRIFRHPWAFSLCWVLFIHYSNPLCWKASLVAPLKVFFTAIVSTFQTVQQFSNLHREGGYTPPCYRSFKFFFSSFSLLFNSPPWLSFHSFPQSPLISGFASSFSGPPTQHLHRHRALIEYTLLKPRCSHEPAACSLSLPAQIHCKDSFLTALPRLTVRICLSSSVWRCILTVLCTFLAWH